MMVIFTYLTCSLSAHHYLSDPGSVWVRRRRGWVEEGRIMSVVLVYPEWEEVIDERDPPVVLLH